MKRILVVWNGASTLWSCKKQKKTSSYSCTAVFTVAVQMCLSNSKVTMQNVSRTTGFCFFICDSISIYCGQKVSADKTVWEAPSLMSWKRLILILYFEYSDLLYSYSSLWLCLLQEITYILITNFCALINILWINSNQCTKVGN